MARLAGLVVGSRSMCPTNRFRREATVSCSATCPVRAITSSFVTWSRHEMPKILLRHRRWKTSIILLILLILLVVFHVSLINRRCVTESYLQKVTGWWLASNSSWQIGHISSSLISRCGMVPAVTSAVFCVSAGGVAWAWTGRCEDSFSLGFSKSLISRSTSPSCHETTPDQSTSQQNRIWNHNGQIMAAT